MKILVLADIHANRYALEAVLDKESHDAVIFLGDAVDFGPDPKGCIRFLMKSSGSRFWGVRGDHDHAMAFGKDCNSISELTALSAITREWGEGFLASEEVGFLRRLPLESSFSIDRLNFHIVHGSDINCSDRDGKRENYIQEKGEEEKDFILVGHSHKPFVKRSGKTTILNPGSVGQPRDFNPRASYAVIENGEATIKRTSYDIESTVRDLERSALPVEAKGKLISMLVLGGIVDGTSYI